TARVHLSRVLAALGRTEEAAEEQRRAVAEYDRLMAIDPNQYRTNMASVMLTLAPGVDLRPAPPAEEPAQRTGPCLPAEPPEQATGTSTIRERPTADAEPPAAAAETRGHFTITEALGRGGLGSIWAARDHDLGRLVALKELNVHLADNREATSRFL